MNESLSQLRTRLDACARAIEEALHALPESAPVPFEPRKIEPSLTCFLIAGEAFALADDWIQGSPRQGLPTPLPMGSPGCVGVLDVDGQLLPVFDPGVLLGLRSEPARAGTLLPVGDRVAECVLLTDHLERRTISAEAHAPPWPLPLDVAALVEGLLEDGTVLLDGARLLEDPRLGTRSA